MGIRSKSGIKRARQAKKRQARNLGAKKVVRQAFKMAERAIKSSSSEALDLLNKAYSAIDKAVQRGIVHRNKAARKKSRLSKKLKK